MTYVPGYDFDLFISYAHVDNEAIEPATHGWVDALIGILALDLGMKLGRSEAFSIWRDEQNLRGNHEVNGHIPEQVKRSALFLAVLSPGYVSSTFCLLELQTFINALGESAAERLFVVYKEPLVEGRHKMPEAFAGPRKYQFWVPDRNQKPRVLGWPLPRNDVPEDRQYYYPKIGDLSADIVFKLDELKKAAGMSAPAPDAQVSIQPGKPTVLLAEVTDDLETRRDEVRRYLVQEGIQVLPTGSYRLARKEFEQALTADLGKSAAFVQLLGPVAGKCPPDVPDGFGWLQLEMARSRTLPILQWRSHGPKTADITIPHHKRLLELETVQAMPIEDFKQLIVRTLARKEVPKTETERPSFVFINADSVDMEYARSILDNLGDKFDWAMPLYDPAAKTETLQEYMEQSLIDCDGLVLVYGKTRPDWIMSQLQLYRKLAPRRAKEPRVLALVNAPPEPKLPLPMGLRGWTTLEIAEAPARIKSSLAT